MDDIPSFGAWLKQRRKALDLTQEALARRVGCSIVSIRKFEGDTQRPSRQLAELLATQLAIPPDERATFVQFARVGLDVAPPELPLPAAARPPTRSAASPPPFLDALSTQSSQQSSIAPQLTPSRAPTVNHRGALQSRPP